MELGLTGQLDEVIHSLDSNTYISIAGSRHVARRRLSTGGRQRFTDMTFDRSLFRPLCHVERAIVYRKAAIGKSLVRRDLSKHVQLWTARTTLNASVTSRDPDLA